MKHKAPLSPEESIKEIDRQTVQLELTKERNKQEREAKRLAKERQRRRNLLSKLVAPLLLIATMLTAYILFKVSR